MARAALKPHTVQRYTQFYSHIRKITFAARCRLAVAMTNRSLRFIDFMEKKRWHSSAAVANPHGGLRGQHSTAGSS
eukprot:138740-Chlamydomonas_euryale.AAC.2